MSSYNKAYKGFDLLAHEQSSSNGTSETEALNGTQHLPNFLFGNSRQSSTSRRRFAVPSKSNFSVSSPGILKRESNFSSLGQKNVHWSPLLVRERSNSPESKFKIQEVSTDLSLGGPPLRSITDNSLQASAKDLETKEERGDSNKLIRDHVYINGTKMIPSVSVNRQGRSRLSTSASLGIRPLNSVFSDLDNSVDNSFNFSARNTADDSFIEKIWNHEQSSSNGTSEIEAFNGTQHLPNFIFDNSGQGSTTSNHSFAIPSANLSVSSPGILKRKSNFASPSQKNLHWSPLLVRERSNSPESKFKLQEVSTDLSFGGPPLRSITDNSLQASAKDLETKEERGDSNKLVRDHVYINGTKMIPSVSVNRSASFNLQGRSRLSTSARVGIRPLNSALSDLDSSIDNSFNLSARSTADDSFLGKLWNMFSNS